MTAVMSVPERVGATLRFQPVDRLPVVEWATWWDKTLARWRGEGLPTGVDPFDYFGLDPLRQVWLGAADRERMLPHVRPDGSAIQNLDDYHRLKKHLCNFEGSLAFDEARWRKIFAEQEAGTAAVWFTLEGFFWFPRTWMGIEQHLYNFYDEPELMHAFNRDLADYHLRLIEKIRPLGRPVFMTFAEDMSYNHGPMLSEAMFDEFLLPYYRRVIPALEAWGVVPLVDSDGDITSAWPWFARAGLSGILPLERQAGVDAAVLRETFPDMLMVGHFDKMTMPLGEDAMRAEWERLLPTARKGGFIPSVDHQTPPGVSLEQYRSYVKLAHEYARRAAQA